MATITTQWTDQERFDSINSSTSSTMPVSIPTVLQIIDQDGNVYYWATPTIAEKIYDPIEHELWKGWNDAN